MLQRPIVWLVAGTVLAVVMFLVGWRAEYLGTEARELTATHSRAVAIGSRVSEIQNILAAFAALMSVRRDIDETGFRSFGEGFEWRRTGVENVGWVPRVQREERKAFEQTHSGAEPFQILGFAGDGKLGPADEAGEYFPLTLVLTTIEGQRIPYGFDLSSEPMRREAIDTALKTGRYTVSPLVAVNNKVAAGDGLRIVALYPVSDTPGLPDPGDSQAIKGFVAAVVNVGAVMESAVADRPEQRQTLALTQRASARDSERLLHVLGGGAQTPSSRPVGTPVSFALDDAISEPVPVAGSQWTLYSQPGEAIAWVTARRATPIPVVVLILSVGIAMFLRQLQRMRLSSKQLRDGELERLRVTDELTGLPNRRYLLTHLSNSAGLPRALLILNIRRFRRVVESMGDHAADQVLRAFADQLCAMVDRTSLVARLGGDEFALVRTGPGASMASMQALAARLRRALHKAIVVDGQTLHLQCAMAGVHAVEDSMSDGETVLARATAAMRRSKALTDHDDVPFDNGGDGIDGRRRMSMETALRSAFDAGGVQVFFQPQVTAQSLTLHGFESLVRWQHDGRWIPPTEFLDVASEADLMGPIYELVLERSLSQAAAWRKQHPQFQGRVAINISAEQFARPRFVADLLRKITQLGAAGTWLELELTEGILVENIGRTQRALQELAEAGIHTALDDFGTGYSSLAYLKDLPVQWIKIDRSFVRGLQSDRGSAAIVRGTLAMARALRVEVIAEGVETVAQFERLKALGCNVMQGYLFSAAVPADATRSFFDGFQLPPEKSALVDADGEALRRI